jgi:hypothetical protein
VNAHGRRSQGPAQAGWILLVIAAALIGGLAAATLVHASVLLAVIVSVVVGGVAVLAVFRSPATGRRQAPTLPQAVPQPPSGSPPAASPRPAASPPPAASPRSAASPPPAPARAAPPAAFTPGDLDPVAPGSAETVVQLLPLPGSADAPWWDSAQGAPPPSPGAKRAPAPDLSSYLASTFIAQCPRCGAFRLDIRRAGSDWNFRCESCEYTWTWQPGTPWPPVRVKPRERPPAP